MAKKKQWQELLLKNQKEGVIGTSDVRDHNRRLIKASAVEGSSILPSIGIDAGFNPLKAGYNAIAKTVEDITSNPKVTQVEVGALNKLQRARILLNRSTSGMEQVDTIDEVNSRYVKPKTTNDSRKARDEKWKLVHSSSSTDITESTSLALAKENKLSKRFHNKVIIVNESSKPLASIEIMYFNNVEVNPETTWATVKSMGRNNPFYMFTGSEDTITFEVSWRAMEDNREDVLIKCRLLESWTKADGYSASPPILGISWGSSNIFAGDHFILKSAPYKPSNFQNSYRKGPRKGVNEVIDLGLLPNIATQTLTFCRVTGDNRSRESIVPLAKLNVTKGITVKG